MSHLIAKITDINSKEILHRVTLFINEIKISLISLELDPAIKTGKEVRLHIKPTNVIISLNPIKDISIVNQIPCIIENIELGQILTRINLKCKTYTFESIITTQMAQKLNLKTNNQVFALINESDLSLSTLES